MAEDMSERRWVEPPIIGDPATDFRIEFPRQAPLFQGVDPLKTPVTDFRHNGFHGLPADRRQKRGE